MATSVQSLSFLEMWTVTSQWVYFVVPKRHCTYPMKTLLSWDTPCFAALELSQAIRNDNLGLLSKSLASMSTAISSPMGAFSSMSVGLDGCGEDKIFVRFWYIFLYSDFTKWLRDGYWTLHWLTTCSRDQKTWLYSSYRLHRWKTVASWVLCNIA